MEFDIEEMGKYKIIKFKKNEYIDVNSIGEFKADLLDIVNKGDNFIVIDFEQVIHIDSSGIGGMIEVMRTITSKTGKLFFSNVSPEILEIFDVTKLTGFFKIFKTAREMRIQLLRDK